VYTAHAEPLAGNPPSSRSKLAAEDDMEVARLPDEGLGIDEGKGEACYHVVAMYRHVYV
jgi:hypothetical protein